jgi:2',3'-cyclic-nucleotide 2'-phosphodiesterase (5'-nucleotidase family)
VYHLSDASEDRYSISGESKIPEDKKISDIIAPYKIELEKIMLQQIGVSKEIMYKKRPESTLGNWFVDIVHQEADRLYKGKVDFSIQNYGGIRVTNLAAGPITIGEIYEVMPFENQLVVMEARGIVVEKLFSHIARYGGWPVSKNVKVRANQDGKLKYLKINGEKINPTQTYHFALPDYIANGGDQCSFLKNQDRVELGVKIRDVVIDYLKKSGPEQIESAEIENRFTFINR